MIFKILKYLCQFYIPVACIFVLRITIWDRYNFDRVSVVQVNNSGDFSVFTTKNRNFKSAKLYRFGLIAVRTFTLPRDDDCTRSGSLNVSRYRARLHDTRQTHIPRIPRDNYSTVIIRRRGHNRPRCSVRALIRRLISLSRFPRRTLGIRSSIAVTRYNAKWWRREFVVRERRRKSRVQPSFVSFFGCVRT